jgi:hypothetical protein
LRYFTSNFTPKTTLLRDSMSLVIYGGAKNGHGFHLSRLSPVGAVVSTCVRRIYTAFAARGSVH